MLYGPMDETSNPRPEDPGSSCPTCGKDAGYFDREHSWTEPHGEDCYQRWLVCKACGAETDDDELIAIRREVMA